MSWFDRARAAAAVLMALGLGGCFQPLYGEAAHPGLVDDLRAVEVAPIKDRIGHYLGDDLQADLNGTGDTPEPKYRLTVTVSLGTATPTVTSQLQVANAATVTANTTFTLTPAGGGTALMTGTASDLAISSMAFWKACAAAAACWAVTSIFSALLASSAFRSSAATG